MENSSKAILIAGAILLTMAIIGIGMLIFSQTNTTIDNMGNDIDGMAVTAHNTKFNNYIGEISGRQVMECVQKALQINSSEEIDDVFKGITVSLDGFDIVVHDSDAYTIPSTFKTNDIYYSKVQYDDNGIIKAIEISNSESFAFVANVDVHNAKFDKYNTSATFTGADVYALQEEAVYMNMDPNTQPTIGKYIQVLVYSMGVTQKNPTFIVNDAKFDKNKNYKLTVNPTKYKNYIYSFNFTELK